MSAPTTQRFELLDALRGFALFGVVWSNYAMLAYWWFLPPEVRDALPGARLDQVLEGFHTILIEGKFYSLFSLLFGIGFGLFLDKGRTGHWRFVRRMVVLALIGWLHLRYLWEGDILFLYAVLGLLLPLFRGLRDRALPWLAALLILSPIAMDTATVLTDGAFAPHWLTREHALAVTDADMLEEVGEDPVGWARFVPEGGVREWQLWLHSGWLWRMDHILGSNRIPKVLGLFLLGLWVARKGLFRDLEHRRPLLRRTLRLGLLVGLPMSVLMYWSDADLEGLPAAEGLVHTVGYAFGVVPLALAYAAGFALLWLRPAAQRRLQVLVPMGRMALTNYLMQTVIAILLFTGVGLGLGAHVSAITFESLALGVYLVQVAWSHGWLARFQYGPMEWLWRSLTYGKVMPMRK